MSATAQKAFPSLHIPDREYSIMTPADLAATVKATRRALKLTQAELAAASGVGIRFVVELEAGKPTVQLGKALAAPCPTGGVIASSAA